MQAATIVLCHFVQKKLMYAYAGNERMNGVAVWLFSIFVFGKYCK